MVGESLLKSSRFFSDGFVMEGKNYWISRWINNWWSYGIFQQNTLENMIRNN